MKKQLTSVGLSLLVLFGLSLSVNQAAALTAGQMEAISALMRSFGADETVVKNVQMSLDKSTISKAAQSASRASVQVNKKAVSQNQAFDGDIDPEGPVSSCVALTTNLRYRSRDAQTNGQVSLLQDFLQSHGFLNSEPTGYFGLLSLKAVKAFQKSVGIEPTGFVGALTRAKIKELSCGNIYPYPLPTPKPVPVPIPFPTPLPTPVPSNLEVISPNGGETWQKGTTQLIRWAQRTVSTQSTSPASPAETSATGQNAIVLPLTVNISLTSYTPPCTVGPCPAMPTAIYLIASNAPNTGEYRWTVGATTNSNTTIPDGAYVMQVCAGSACDQSNSYFKIFSQSGGNLPPVIDGVSGPTVLDVGQLGTWSVRAHDPENGNLSYSVNWGDDVSSGSAAGGTAPMSISASQTTTFTHNYSRAGAYKVGFTVTDSKGLTAQSTISVNVGATQPSITVLSPNGGENLQSGSSYTVRWISNNLPLNALVNVWLLDNPTRLGSMVLARTPNTGSANWIVSPLSTLTDQKTLQPVTPSGNYVIFIECADHNCTVDDSNSSFTITPVSKPSITVLSPNGGESYKIGETIKIRWTVTGTIDSTKRVYLISEVENGSRFNFGSTYAVNGWYDWVIPPDYSNGEYKIFISEDTDGNDTGDILAGSAHFTITAAQTIPIKSISIDASNNVHLSFSQQASACLQLKDDQGNYFALNSSQLPHSCANSTLFTGYQTELTIPQSSFARTIIAGKYYQVCNADTRGNSYAVCSNPILVTTSTQPSITVLSPNGGETFEKGRQYTVAWHISSFRENRTNFVLELLDASGGPMSNFALINGEPFQGTRQIVLGQGTSNSYQITFPNTIPSGSYKLRVSLCPGDGAATQCLGTNVSNLVSDVSDSYFTITASTAPTITLNASPASVTSGQSSTITWSSTNANKCTAYENGSPAQNNPELVNITGSFTQTFYESKTYTFTCGGPGGYVTKSITVNVGSVTQPSLTVLSPNGGENWATGSGQTIIWNNNVGDSVNISLTNYLSCWESSPACMAPAVLYPIATNVVGERSRIGSKLYWTVGKAQNGSDIPAGQYKVTVSSVASPAVTDQSNSAFTITEITIQSTDSSLNPETVSALAEFSQKKNLNLASILAAIQQLIEAFK